MNGRRERKEGEEGGGGEEKKEAKRAGRDTASLTRAPGGGCWNNNFWLWFLKRIFSMDRFESGQGKGRRRGPSAVYTCPGLGWSRLGHAFPLVALATGLYNGLRSTMGGIGTLERTTKFFPAPCQRPGALSEQQPKTT